MKHYQKILILFFVGLSKNAIPQTNIIVDGVHDQASSKDIYLEVRNNTLNADSTEIYYLSINFLSASKEYIRLKGPKRFFGYSWRIESLTPVLINTGRVLKQHKTWIAEPGDSVIITANDYGLSFIGTGFEKYRVMFEIEQRKQQIPRPKFLNFNYTKSVEDFMQTNAYLNNQLSSVLSLIETYRPQLSDFAFKKIKVNVITNIHEQRLDKFTGLIRLYQEGHIDAKTISDIFDTCFYSEEWRWVLSLPDYAPGWYAFIRAEVARKYNYDYNLDSLKSRELRKFLYYDQGKRTYKGLALEQFLLTLITDETMYEVGFTTQTEKLIERYYKEPGNPEFKKYAKAYELKARTLKNGSTAPEFSLIATNGEPFTKEKLKGKVALLDFWFTGCKGCIQMTPALKALEHKFKNDSNVVFLSISTDKDKKLWLNSIKEQRYTTASSTNVYTGGQGDKHPIIEKYNISGYPTLFLLDGNGNIVQNPLPDPRHNDDLERLSELIEKQLTLLHDGPYVFHTENEYKVNMIQGNKLSTSILRSQLDSLSSHTDQNGQEFTFRLHSKNVVEPAEFTQHSKLFILSDIEGNFDAFRKLLQVNSIIDENFNWTFGTGHLVFAGDMFDRGHQVTECLWLIYSLEEQAKLAGGYVHFILGNHEIMNLSGNTNYVQDKYLNSAALMERPYIRLYGEDAELGRWLRTKNIIEKIGDHLFVHGGISKEILQSSLSLTRINQLARSHYDKDSTARQSVNNDVKILFNSKSSPFWYRLYYLDQSIKYYPTDTLYKTSMEQIDLTLKKFSVKHIITGHTIVAKTISVHYNGKVINTDTKHAEGKSEALLIEGTNYYRVNDKGDRWLLFADEPAKRNDEH